MPESSPAVAAQRFAPGALVTARGREWVVLPETAQDMVVLRPFGGADDEIAAVFPDLEAVVPATFPAPDPRVHPPRQARQRPPPPANQPRSTSTDSAARL